MQNSRVRLRSSAYESSLECPNCELPCKHCGRIKINHFGRAWHCKRYVIDSESDPTFEVEGHQVGLITRLLEKYSVKPTVGAFAAMREYAELVDKGHVINDLLTNVDKPVNIKE